VALFEEEVFILEKCFSRLILKFKGIAEKAKGANSGC
jgi:hypothetical protein